MNTDLLQLSHAFLRRVRFTSFRTGAARLAAASFGAGDRDIAQARVAVQARPPHPQPIQDVVAVLERVNYRLDAIEAKIDLLLVPIEMTTH